jgi:hypothetical protein
MHGDGSAFSGCAALRSFAHARVALLSASLIGRHA